MLKEAIEKILELRKPETITINGRPYYDDSFSPVKDRFPNYLKVNNLTGIVDFILKKPESWGPLFIHVADYNQVTLYKKTDGDFNQRPVLVNAMSRPCNFSFGSRMGIEEFIISLYGMFLNNTDRHYLLKLVSGITIDANAKIEDDGISQTVSAKHGVSSLITDVTIKNPITLQPYRTFSEVEQPASKMIFRLSRRENTPLCSLHECDGEAWKQEAIQNIKAFFEKETPGIPVIA